MKKQLINTKQLKNMKKQITIIALLMFTATSIINAQNGETKYGYYAGANFDGSGQNSAFGSTALLNTVTTAYNSAFGFNAMRYVGLGDYNTSIGWEALKETRDGNYNTGVGYNTQTSYGNANNQTVIGAGATGQADNSVTLGNADVTDIYMSEDSGAALHAGSGYFAGDVVVSSDARLKANIVSLGTTLARLLLIDGKSYTMKKSGEQKIGVLAQDIQKVFPELVVVDQNEMLAVNYQGLVPVLINAMKEQDAKISKLEMMVEKLISDKE